MTIEVFLWVFGLSILPAIGWAIHTTWENKKILYSVEKLVHMHEKPDEFGFGTGGIKEVIQDNTRAVKALTHYIVWVSQQQGHGAPPPLVKSDD